ncbi:hypothetical protein [Candidatus Marimicrobium litorale]|uniref:Methyltransferase domain-containing protein n=1 Tax=Candidatus Marimicrobium litorale TaxID=2518991 RepID=A0ABT3TAK7_9GAMM|nr:hypothetical protein [Candidatus Marimicrobium litorale]MCX2978856.1 hypothetical protein [Candidatus Marimicrobium litorale]
MNTKNDTDHSFSQKAMRLIAKTGFSRLARLMRRSHPEWNPRRWSNQELRRFGALFCGDLINVSGWNDEDKQGDVYANYFPNKGSYSISNFGGVRGASDGGREVSLDLSLPPDGEFSSRYDVVFNHTTLEHVFDVSTAFDVLCDLTRDIVILVVPFMQIEHWAKDSYRDYHRFTEFGIISYFEERGFRVLYISSNHNPVFPIYFFCVASRQPERWGGKFPTGELVWQKYSDNGDYKRSTGQHYKIME